MKTAAPIVLRMMLVACVLVAGRAEAVRSPLSLTPNFSWVDGVQAGHPNRFNGFSSDPAHSKLAERPGVRQSSGAFTTLIASAAARPDASGFRIYAAKSSSETDRSNSISSSALHHDRLKIVTTILPLYCFAAGVAGGVAQVDNLLPENASGHDYQLSAQDGQKLSKATLVIVTGLGLEDEFLGRRLICRPPETSRSSVPKLTVSRAYSLRSQAAVVRRRTLS